MAAKNSGKRNEEKLFYITIVVNSVKIVLLVFARDQGAILVLVPGPSLITCSSHSFNTLFF